MEFILLYTLIIIICLLLFLWISKKFWETKKHTKHKLPITALVTLLLFPIFHRITIVLVLLIICYYYNENFNKAAWSNNNRQRYKFSDSIIKNKLLDHKNKNEIKDLLGKPDKITNSEKMWWYSLGNRPGFHIDPDILIINFKDSIVDNYKILYEGTRENRN